MNISTINLPKHLGLFLIIHLIDYIAILLFTVTVLFYIHKVKVVILECNKLFLSAMTLNNLKDLL